MIAAPGRPKAWPTPSRSCICARAWIARIRGMVVSCLLRGKWGAEGRPSASVAAGELLDLEQQRGVVEGPVTLGPQCPHQLGHERTDRDRHPGLAGRAGDNAHVLVVQVDAEARGELAG